MNRATAMSESATGRPTGAKGLLRPSPSRAESFADSLRSQLRDGLLTPGQRLGTKADLRQSYGVATGTLNEGLRLLQVQGLVEVRPGPGGGIFIARHVLEPESAATYGDGLQLPVERPGDPQQLTDYLAIRDALDPLVIREAARYAGPEDAVDLRAGVQAMFDAVGDDLAFLHANWRLHVRLAAIGPNVVLSSLYSQLMDRIQAGVASVVPDRDMRPGALERAQVHADLVEAVLAADMHRLRAAEAAHEAFAHQLADRVGSTTVPHGAPPYPETAGSRDGDRAMRGAR
jgi:DNA-binding FadR family transcriptional regulator